MNKTLGAIQTLAKIGRIISKVVFILCVVGASLCVVGLISLIAIPQTLEIGDVTLHSLIEDKAGMTVGGMYSAVTVGIILAAGEAVVAKFAEIYFRHEIADGNPFTFTGARELLRLGIITAAVSLGTAVAAGIAQSIFGIFVDNLPDFSIEIGGSLGYALAFIILSLVFKYGAERFGAETR